MLTLYEISHPENLRAFIGLTRRDPKRLIHEAKCASRSRHGLGVLLRELKAAGLRPEIKVLAEGLNGDARQAKRAHMAALRSQGLSLMNDYPRPPMAEATKRKISASNLGKPKIRRKG